MNIVINKIKLFVIISLNIWKNTGICKFGKNYWKIIYTEKTAMDIVRLLNKSRWKEEKLWRKQY